MTVLACVLAWLAGTPVFAQDAVIDTLALRAHTRFLSHDLLEGRGAGTRGEHIAAAYIAAQLQWLGLSPAGADFLQPVPLTRVRVRPETSLTISRGADTAVFSHGRHFSWGAVGRDGLRAFAGPAVYVGTAAQSRAASRRQLRGSVVVAVGPLAAEALRLIPLWREAGVQGVVLLIPQKEAFDRIAAEATEARHVLDAEIDDPVWQPALPILYAGPDLMPALLSGARLPTEALSGAPMRPVSLDRFVDATPAFTEQRVRAANVAAVLIGSDTERRHQHLVYIAHYDHLGIGQPTESGDSIYNGFSDNSAGVAMLLAIAAVMSAEPPPVSVLFLFPTAEERGLLGSTFFAARPLVPLDDLIGVINLDAGAPPAPPVSWRIAADRSRLASLARSIATRRGWRVERSPASPNSDYWPFARAGVPAIFLIPGNEWENLSGDERDALRQRWDRYHRADDEWHPDFPFLGLERYANLALEIGRAAANR